MTAYVVFLRESPIHTPSEMAEYQRKGQLNPRDPNMLPLAVYGPQITLEGEAPDGAVILQFPTVEDAQAWYNGPYKETALHRQAAADYRGFIIEGYAP
jgi:uncharacterized protein (DUF1330 family)